MIGSDNKLSSKTFNLEELEDKEIIFVNFFAPDCPPCEKEVPELEKFVNEILPKNKSAAFYAIGSSLTSLAEGEEQSDEEVVSEVLRFKQQFKLKGDVYAAGTKKLRSYRVKAFPETYVFYRNEKGYFLQRKFISSVTAKQLSDYIYYRTFDSLY